jgi:hypothetical protein
MLLTLSGWAPHICAAACITADGSLSVCWLYTECQHIFASWAAVLTGCARGTWKIKVKCRRGTQKCATPPRRALYIQFISEDGALFPWRCPIIHSSILRGILSYTAANIDHQCAICSVDKTQLDVLKLCPRHPWTTYFLVNFSYSLHLSFLLLFIYYSSSSLSMNSPRAGKKLLASANVIHAYKSNIQLPILMGEYIPLSECCSTLPNCGRDVIFFFHFGRRGVLYTVV